jgi:hypothetical protein
MEQVHIEVLEAADAKVRKRLIASLSLFAIFIALNVAAALTHRVDEWGVGLFVVVIAAILLLPREPVPAGISFDDTPEGRQWLERTVRTRIYLGYTRAAMLVLSIAAAFGLPELVG